MMDLHLKSFSRECFLVCFDSLLLFLDDHRNHSLLRLFDRQKVLFVLLFLFGHCYGMFCLKLKYFLVLFLKLSFESLQLFTLFALSKSFRFSAEQGSSNVELVTFGCKVACWGTEVGQLLQRVFLKKRLDSTLRVIYAIVTLHASHRGSISETLG